MAVLAKENTGGDFTPIPEDTYMGRCVRVVELGHLYNPRFGSVAHKVLLSFEVIDDTVRYKNKDGDMVRPVVSREFTLSLSSKANLRPLLESWRGKSFTPDDLKDGFDIMKVVGAACMLTIVHNYNEQSGKTYANISSIVKPPNGMVVPAAEQPLLTYEVSMREGGTFDQLEEWIVKKIRDSVEFTAKEGSAPEKANGQAIHPIAANPELVNNPNSEHYVEPSDLPF